MPAAPAALLNHLTGVWSLRGTIAGKPTIHDVQAGWVLNHEYVQLQEISRETNASGNPAYEAIVYIGWDAKAEQFVCLWLDSTSGDGLSSGIIAVQNRPGIRFLSSSLSRLPIKSTPPSAMTKPRAHGSG